jgi:hypothetical protein
MLGEHELNELAGELLDVSSEHEFKYSPGPPGPPPGPG